MKYDKSMITAMIANRHHTLTNEDFKNRVLLSLLSRTCWLSEKKNEPRWSGEKVVFTAEILLDAPFNIELESVIVTTQGMVFVLPTYGYYTTDNTIIWISCSPDIVIPNELSFDYAHFRRQQSFVQRRPHQH